MLERYFVKPSTVDRIRASWLAPEIECYVEWMDVQGYAIRNVYRRVPILCRFAEFAKLHGSIDWIVAHRSEDLSKLDLVGFAKDAQTAKGLICLPTDNVLRELSLNKTGDTFKLANDPLAGKVTWTVKASTGQ